MTSEIIKNRLKLSSGLALHTVFGGRTKHFQVLNTRRFHRWMAAWPHVLSVARWRWKRQPRSWSMSRCWTQPLRGADAMGIIDVDPESRSYGKTVGQVDMPNAGDELHYFGWNACSSCLCLYSPHPHMERRCEPYSRCPPPAARLGI